MDTEHNDQEQAPDEPEQAPEDHKQPKQKRQKSQSSGGCPVYGLGIIGAWIYFGAQAEEPADYALAFLKGLFWPAFMVYEGFSALARLKDE
jgi:hypothetical protein